VEVKNEEGGDQNLDDDGDPPETQEVLEELGESVSAVYVPWCSVYLKVSSNCFAGRTSVGPLICPSFCVSLQGGCMLCQCSCVSCLQFPVHFLKLVTHLAGNLDSFELGAVQFAHFTHDPFIFV
jgi:hypothetical protein